VNVKNYSFALANCFSIAFSPQKGEQSIRQLYQ